MSDLTYAKVYNKIKASASVDLSSFRKGIRIFLKYPSMPIQHHDLEFANQLLEIEALLSVDEDWSGENETEFLGIS